ncbi:Mitochondrial outer membrane protein iml2 [Cadophora gregata]|nr:Mitochondrial outer membrane protein iml2 [Cadophora gregata]KAK0108540.1 Mitochondrial outer membrane protein iml2 [Cadophora gregata]
MTRLGPGDSLISDTSAWFKKPVTYTAFADYAVKQNVVPRSRVSDTGVSLRALLPIPQKENRVSLQEYQGSATVLDTRVVCVSPDAALDESGNVTFLAVPQEVLQNYSASPGNSRLLQDLTSRAVIPSSGIKILPDGNFTLNQISTELSRSLLLSQFDEIPAAVNVRANTFNQYIIVNVPVPFLNNTIPKPLGNPTQDIVGDWLHLVYEDLPRNVVRGKPFIRISLCYNALSAVDMDIQAATTRSRNETAPQRTTSSGAVFNFEAIRYELGEERVAPNDRGLLEIKFPGGTPVGPLVGSNSSDYISKAQLMSQDPNTTVNSISMVSQRGVANSSHPDVAFLFNEIMTSTFEPSLGFAMQSMITILAQTAYQEHLPFFGKSTGVRLTPLTHASIPGGQMDIYSSAPAGFLSDYIAVVVVTIFHLLLMAVITYLFLCHTTISTLHNTWQAISQIHEPLTSRYLTSHFASDTEVTQWTVEDKRSNIIVQITSNDDGRTTGLKEVTSVSRDAFGDAEEGGLEISHWDERLRGGYFHNENVRAGRSVPGRHPWQGERPPWS